MFQVLAAKSACFSPYSDWIDWPAVQNTIGHLRTQGFVAIMVVDRFGNIVWNQREREVFVT